MQSTDGSISAAESPVLPSSVTKSVSDAKSSIKFVDTVDPP